jgi:hypothetical protein
MNIVVNGQQYASWDDVPDEIRTLLGSTGALPDSNHDGVPDLFEGGPLPTSETTVQSTTIDVDGVTYHSLEDVPPEVRSALAAAGLLGARSSNPPSASRQVTPTSQPPQPSGEVLLNGVPVAADGSAKRKHWWQRR